MCSQGSYVDAAGWMIHIGHDLTTVFLTHDAITLKGLQFVDKLLLHCFESLFGCLKA